ncbi:MAG: 4Fe-4S binding protein [Bacteroidales bacterium]
MKVNLIYFSATYTTKRISEYIANGVCSAVQSHDVTNTSIKSDIELNDTEDLLIVAMPVYAGRIPPQAVKSLNRFKTTTNTPAIILCVYGNREYDDALIEMWDIVKGNGFRVISAAAFVAQHSIFPKVAANRPDADDWCVIDNYINKCKELLADKDAITEIEVIGNRPYKTPGSIPITPTGNRRCKNCGVCAELCPVGAIDKANPRKTDAEICIHCGRCIVVCSQKARNFHSLLYKVASYKFSKANTKRKSPEIIPEG